MEKMIDMAFTKDEISEEKRKYSANPDPSVPTYPWGLAIRLEQSELDKLGLKTLPQVGSEVHMIAVGKVTGINSNDRSGDKPETCVAIQITMLEVAPEADHPGEKQETVADENREQARMNRGGNVLSNAYRGTK